MAKKKSDPVTTYAQSVVKKKTLACEFVRLACERHLKLLKQAKLKGYYFDAEEAQHVIDFFPRFIRHVKGEWAGCRFEPEPWQQFIIGYIFGWKKSDGMRLVETAYIEVPRKNGKTTLDAGLCLYLLVADGEEGAEVYCAATKRDQARYVFDPAKRMVQKSPALRRRLKAFKLNISDEETFSKFEPLGADKDTMDGANSHGVIIDELHAHKNRGVWDVLVNSTGSRRQPLVIATTTAGLQGESICREQHDYGERVLNGIIQDDTFFAYIATIDEGDDWADEASWWKANPNLGVSKKIEKVRADCKKALETPAAQNTFRRYHLNEWVQQETRWMDLKKWDATAGLVVPDQLVGKSCYGGLDLANKIDIAAFVLVFPPKEENGDFRVLPFFWVPEEGMLERARKDRVPYDVWARRGLIEVTEGSVIDYVKIREDIIALSKIYHIEEIVYDEWNAWQMAQELEDEGFTMVAMRQGFKSYNSPTKELMRLVLAKRMKHGGNPVLRWMADNMVVSTDAAGNLKPNKEKSREKIDGMTALIEGLSRAVVGEDSSSVYDERGLLTL